MFVIDPTTRKMLSDLPTAGLMEAAAKARGKSVPARLVPSSPGNTIAYLADGTEPESAKSFPVVNVKVVS